MGLQDDFHRHFEILAGTSRPLVEAVQALRYQVYCLETGFEDAANFPDGREEDDFDAHSVHGLIRLRGTEMPLATVRLVLAGRDKLARPLPMEIHCGEALEETARWPGGIPRGALAEISRFAVSKQAMRQCWAKARGDSRQLMLQVTLGLFHTIVRMSAESGVRYWYAVMEPALLRLLSRFGIEFHKLGGLINYHGWRQPCVGDVGEVLAGIYEHRREIWNFITDAGKLWQPPLQRPAAA